MGVPPEPLRSADLNGDGEEDAGEDRGKDEGHGEVVDGREWPKRDLTVAKEERKRKVEMSLENQQISFDLFN